MVNIQFITGHLRWPRSCVVKIITQNNIKKIFISFLTSPIRLNLIDKLGPSLLTTQLNSGQDWAICLLLSGYTAKLSHPSYFEMHVYQQLIFPFILPALYPLSLFKHRKAIARTLTARASNNSRGRRLGMTRWHHDANTAGEEETS